MRYSEEEKEMWMDEWRQIGKSARAYVPDDSHRLLHTFLF